jgi:hypothetical protein
MMYRTASEERTDVIKKGRKYQFKNGKMFALLWNQILLESKEVIPPSNFKLLEELTNDFEKRVVQQNHDEETLLVIIDGEVGDKEKRFNNWKTAIYGPTNKDEWKKEVKVEGKIQYERENTEEIDAANDW